MLNTAPKWKQPECASAVDWINILYIHVTCIIFMEYYIAVKINIVEPHATVRMNLNIILRGKKKQDAKEYIQYESIYIRLKKKAK